jgi:GTP-binding protein
VKDSPVRIPAAAVPTVAIVGRPNVGKSTFLNRVVGRRAAIVEERPGVTRDRKEVDAEWAGRRFRVIDTGGWLPGGSALDEKVSRQSERAMREADIIVVVVDTTVGITEEDAAVAQLVRRLEQPVFLAANKVDDARKEALIWDFVSLGVGDPWPLSALHGNGSADLLDAIVAVLPEPEPEPASAPDPDELASDLAGHEAASEPPHRSTVPSQARKVFSVALVGRPNVGKSTLFNRLIGEERSVVHDIAGTTRDSVDTVVQTDEGPIRFVDTAGMRRKSRIDEGTEYYSLVRALQAVDEADVALLVIDATVGVTHQDQRLAERVDAAGCPVVVLLNKWELLDAEERLDVTYQVGDKLHFLGEAPVLKISALTGKGVHRLLPALSGSVEDYRRRIPTTEVNRVLRAAQAAHPAPGGARVLYATPGATQPPPLTQVANRELPRTYLKFLENRLREEFELGTTPLKLRVRRRT